MPVNDELLARADRDLELFRIGGYEATAELVADLLVALRAALAARPQACFEGNVNGMTIWGGARQAMGLGTQCVVVYPAAESATPTRDEPLPDDPYDLDLEEAVERRPGDDGG